MDGEDPLVLPEGVSGSSTTGGPKLARVSAALRFHNGWVPWYGNPPSTYVWWVQQSLGSVFWVTSSWDAEREIVHMEMKSGMERACR